MDELGLLIDLHTGQDRQGPGDDAETRRAIELCRLDTHAPLRIADLGCGTGASTLVLADALPGRITALDAAEPFIERLRTRVAHAGVSDRIDAHVGDMGEPPFEDESLDLIWSEGAIYNIGFEAGLRAWRRLLRPGGVIAVSELTWTSATRPEQVDAYWRREYPGIDTPAGKLRQIEAAGYEPLGCFLLPPHCWRANYNEPVRAALPGFLDRHGHDASATRVAREAQAEIDLHEQYGAWYSYAFFIARRVDGD